MPIIKWERGGCFFSASLSCHSGFGSCFISTTQTWNPFILMLTATLGVYSASAYCSAAGPQSIPGWTVRINVVAFGNVDSLYHSTLCFWKWIEGRKPEQRFALRIFNSLMLAFFFLTSVRDFSIFAAVETSTRWIQARSVLLSPSPSSLHLWRNYRLFPSVTTNCCCQGPHYMAFTNLASLSCEQKVAGGHFCCYPVWLIMSNSCSPAVQRWQQWQLKGKIALPQGYLEIQMQNWNMENATYLKASLSGHCICSTDRFDAVFAQIPFWYR